jgi:hypothetical protein
MRAIVFCLVLDSSCLVLVVCCVVVQFAASKDATTVTTNDQTKVALLFQKFTVARHMELAGAGCPCTWLALI